MRKIKQSNLLLINDLCSKLIMLYNIHYTTLIMSILNIFILILIFDHIIFIFLDDL